ncbi:MAG: archease [Candidatus Thermoplasmatota archaeon]
MGIFIYPRKLSSNVKRFEELDHTADVGIRAYGRTLDELFANAAAGMFSLVTDLDAVKPVGEYEVKVASRDLKSLLVDFLSELIVVHETEKVLLAEFDVKVSGLAVDARVRGERIDKARHPLHLMVKAVTYHGIDVDEEKGEAQVIFDI